MNEINYIYIFIYINKKIFNYLLKMSLTKKKKKNSITFINQLNIIYLTKQST